MYIDNNFQHTLKDNSASCIGCLVIMTHKIIINIPKTATVTIQTLPNAHTRHTQNASVTKTETKNNSMYLIN